MKRQLMVDHVRLALESTSVDNDSTLTEDAEKIVDGLIDLGVLNPDPEPQFLSVQEAVQVLRRSAWPSTKDCIICDGSGRVSDGNKILHTVRGGFGADNDSDDVIEEVQGAQMIERRKTIRGDAMLVYFADRPGFSIDSLTWEG